MIAPANSRVSLFGIEIDPLRMGEAVARCCQWIETDAEPRCRFVVTPNVDHAVLLQESEPLRAAYRDASLVLADGMPVVLASRILGRPLPERVTGADLVPALFGAATAEHPQTAYLLGAGPGVAERAAEQIHFTWPHVRVVGCYSPPMGFEKDTAENEAIIARVNEVRPDILVLGLGAPKQELWVHAHHTRLKTKVALCVGATIDFLAGEKPRAPIWMRSCGLEWLHRLLSEPQRLLSRYAKDAWVFPQLVWQEWRRR
jgi:N-acetylglucosaminyldiphosphoundecaprenol N-acetyl-beta-D-mannosaminyltransferase